MANALAVRNEDSAALMESVVVDGDLSRLTPTQRLDYYQRVCESVGLNPFTRPFDYMRLNGKLVLYAKKDASEQLRKIHGISLSKPDVQYVDDLIVVTIEAIDATGRKDSDIGAVTVGNLKGEAKANAIMKAITKAKRRVTLSIAGLGWLDETELETIPTQAVQRVNVDMATGEIVDVTPVTPATNGNGHKPQAEAPKSVTYTWADKPDAVLFDNGYQFANLAESLAWGVAMGVFNHYNHAKNAYEELKREHKPETPAAMYSLWINDVARRVNEKDAELVTA